MRIKRIPSEFWPRLATLRIHGDEELSTEEYTALKSGNVVEVDDALAQFLIASKYCTAVVGAKPKKAS